MSEHFQTRLCILKEEKKVAAEMQKRRRVSDTVLGGVLPALGLKHQQGIQTRGGHLGSGSTLTAPNPWAVINFEIFWVMLSPKGSCGGSCGGGCGGPRPPCCCASSGRHAPTLPSTSACPSAASASCGCQRSPCRGAAAAAACHGGAPTGPGGQGSATGFSGLANERGCPGDAAYPAQRQFGTACTRCHTPAQASQCQHTAPCHCSCPAAAAAAKQEKVRKLSRDSGVGEERDDGPPEQAEGRPAGASHGQGCCCCRCSCRCCGPRGLACSAARLPVEALKEVRCLRDGRRWGAGVGA